MIQMGTDGPAGPSQSLQWVVFALVGAAFTTMYVTQPALPELQAEYSVSEAVASLTISAVVLGIALSNLPLGAAADRVSIRPIMLVGGMMIAAAGFVCALSRDISVLIGARFVQGLFVPCLTTCVAAYLSRTLPRERLNVVMGSYVAATVAGGLGGRLLGGFALSFLHWRFAFTASAVLVLAATAAAYKWTPPEEPLTRATGREPGLFALVSRADLLRIFLTAFGSFCAFSSLFNYLPFYLSAAPIEAAPGVITLMYVSYLMGIVVGPLAGKTSDRIGNGTTMVLGSLVFAGSAGVTLVSSIAAVGAGLIGVCAGFFAIHAAAVGSLNRKLESGLGRANSVYVLFYYAGGFTGISLSGQVYSSFRWPGVVAFSTVMLLIPLACGLWETLGKGSPHRAARSTNRGEDRKDRL